MSQLSDGAYAGFVDRLRLAKIELSKGKISKVAATTTDLIRFQADLIRARTLGEISEGEMRFFLKKITPALERQVHKETGISVFGFGGGPDDIYDGLFDRIDDLVDDAGLEKDSALKVKTLLFRTAVFLADASEVDKISLPDERLKVQAQISKMIAAKFAGEIEPALKGLAPEDISNSVFLGGRVINIFGGVTRAPSEKSIGEIETRKLSDGRIVQVLKGTNIVVRFAKPEGE